MNSFRLESLCCVLTAAALLFCTTLAHRTGAIPFLNPAAEEQKEALQQQQIRKEIVEGTIYDRFNREITHAEKPQAPAQVSSPAFSSVVGYNSPQYNTSGLRNKYADVLFQPDATGRGRSLQLNLDAELQEFCYQTLGPAEGSVIVLNADTGEVLSLVSRNSAEYEYDVNQIDAPRPGSSDSETWFDFFNQIDGFWLPRATMVQDPPGSTGKILTTIAMIQNGMADYAYDDSLGSYSVGGYNITNYGGARYGENLTVGSALIHSSNTFFASAGVELGSARLEPVLRAFGWGETISTDFGDFTSGFQFHGTKDRAEAAQIAIGQGTLRVSPLHVAMLMCPVANQNGNLYVPSLIRQKMESSDVPDPEFSFVPTLYNQVMTPQEALQVGDLLHQVAVHHGFSEKELGGARAYVKTGTAEVPRKSSDGTPLNHTYYLCGLTHAGSQNLNLSILVSHHNTTRMSGDLKDEVKKIASYLVKN